MRASISISRSHASLSKFSVVVLFWGAFDGDNESRYLDVTTRDDSGESSGAFVNLGPARRMTVAFCGFPVAPEEGCAKSPAPPGVGVDGTAAPLGFGFVARFLGGVTVTAAAGALRFRLAGAGALDTDSASGAARAPRRADRLVAAMVCGVEMKVLRVVKLDSGCVNWRSGGRERRRDRTKGM